MQGDEKLHKIIFEYHECPNLQVGDEVNPRLFFVLHGNLGNKDSRISDIRKNERAALKHLNSSTSIETIYLRSARNQISTPIR